MNKISCFRHAPRWWNKWQSGVMLLQGNIHQRQWWIPLIFVAKTNEIPTTLKFWWCGVESGLWCSHPGIILLTPLFLEEKSNENNGARTERIAYFHKNDLLLMEWWQDRLNLTKSRSALTPWLYEFYEAMDKYRKFYCNPSIQTSKSYSSNSSWQQDANTW